MDTIDGSAALSSYFDCAEIRSQCEKLLTTNVTALSSNHPITDVNCIGPDLLLQLDRAVRFRFPTLNDIVLD